MFVESGLDFVINLQASSAPVLDLLAQLLHFMGGDLFFLMVLPSVYWSLDRRLGLRLLFALVFAGLLTAVMKGVFQLPRPFMVSDAVVPLFPQGDYGLPSGHMLIGTVVWGYAALDLRRRWLWLLLAVYLILVGWSRMYAGVHFPADVAGGLLFGLIGLALYATLAQRIQAVWDRFSIPVHVIVILAAGIISAMLLWDSYDGLAVVGILVGAGLGIELEQRQVRFSSQGSTRQRLLRYLAGITLTFMIFLGLRLLFGALAEEGTVLATVLRILRYALTSVMALYVWPLVMVRTGLAGRME
jgi:membrane-associated phospholipid phosphatase